MAPAEVLDDAIGRAALVEHVGKSGAALERVTLADGRTVVVKRITPETDLTLAIFDQPVAQEFLLWRSGGLDRLPEQVGHVVIDGWTEGEDTTVIVMRDLGDAVLTWDDRLDARACRWVLERVAALHRAYLGDPPEAVGAADSRCSSCSRPHASPAWPATVTSCSRPRSAAGTTSPIRPWCRRTCRRRSSPLHADARPLADALAAGPVTLAHGDLATVNMAFEGDRLILLDWAMPTAAPGALDIARFLVGCAHVVDVHPDEVIDAYRRAAGPAYDDGSMQLALLSALCWLGWNKALDIVESHGCGGARAGAREPRLVGRAGTEDDRERSIVMDLETLYRRTVESWTARVAAVGPDQWGAAHPVCRLGRPRPGQPRGRRGPVDRPADARVDDRGGRRPLRRRPARRRTRARPRATRGRAASRGVAETLPTRGKVHLSYGDEDMEEYVFQLAADHLIHGWDLAVATGGDAVLDDDLVAAVAAWFAEREELYRSAGAIGARAERPTTRSRSCSRPSAATPCGRAEPTDSAPDLPR